MPKIMLASGGRPNLAPPDNAGKLRSRIAWYGKYGNSEQNVAF